MYLLIRKHLMDLLNSFVFFNKHKISHLKFHQQKRKINVMIKPFKLHFPGHLMYFHSKTSFKELENFFINYDLTFIFTLFYYHSQKFYDKSNLKDS